MAEEQPTKVAKLAPEQSPAAASKAADVSELKELPKTDAVTASDTPSLTEKKVDLPAAAKEAVAAEKPAEDKKDEKTEEPAAEKVEDAAANGKDDGEKEEDKTEDKPEEEPKEETVADLGNGAAKFVADTLKTAVGMNPSGPEPVK